MRLEMEITKKSIAIAIVFLCAGATVGYAANGQGQQSQAATECPTELRLAEEDFNALAAISLIGDCEKLGLQPNIFIQDFNGVPYGIPVCVENQRRG